MPADNFIDQDTEQLVDLLVSTTCGTVTDNGDADCRTCAVTASVQASVDCTTSPA